MRWKNVEKYVSLRNTSPYTRVVQRHPCTNTQKRCHVTALSVGPEGGGCEVDGEFSRIALRERKWDNVWTGIRTTLLWTGIRLLVNTCVSRLCFAFFPFQMHWETLFKCQCSTALPNANFTTVQCSRDTWCRHFISLSVTPVVPRFLAV